MERISFIQNLHLAIVQCCFNLSPVRLSQHKPDNLIEEYHVFPLRSRCCTRNPTLDDYCTSKNISVGREHVFVLASVVPKEMPQRYVISRKLWCFVKSNKYGCPTWSRNSSTTKTYFIFMVALFSIQNIKGIFVVFLPLFNSKEFVWASLGKYNSRVQFGHKFSLVAKLNGTEWILCLPSKGQTFLLRSLSYKMWLFQELFHSL